MQRGFCGAFVVCLAAAVPAFGQQAGVAQFTQPNATSCPSCLVTSPPNLIVLDASAGNLMFPLSGSPRAFASASDLATFLRQNLNATPIYDSVGNVIGASGGLLQIGRTYYLDATNVVRPVTEPISAFLGGLSASFTVAGVTYSTGVQGQDYLVPQRLASAPTDVYQCNSAGECISGHSWNTHLIAHIRDSVGIEVDQETGGYQESHYLCFKFFVIPWSCTSSSGSNQLTLQGTLFYDPFLVTGTGPSYTAVAYTVTIRSLRSRTLPA